MSSLLKKTHTLTTKIDPPFGEEFQIAATLSIIRPGKDNHNNNNRIPISLFLSKVGTDTEMGCYVYTIVHKITGKFYQTLLNNSEETLVDFTKKMGGLISRKFSVPSYVCISGDWSLEELITTIHATVKFIDESFLEEI